MTFLELVKALRQECEGVAGGYLTTTVGQTGENKRFVDWTSNAWMEIQGMYPDWDFMRSSFSFNTVNGTGEYTTTDAGIASTYRSYHTDTFRSYLQSIGVADEQYLVEWDYRTLQDTYRYGTRMIDRPTVFCIDPQSRIGFGPIPNAAYTIVGEYQKRAAAISGDSTVPSAPEHLHMAIVYKAMEYYGLYESASEVVARGQRQFAVLLNQMISECRPAIGLGDPLA